MRKPNPRAALALLLLAALGALALTQQRPPRRLPIVEIVNDAHPRTDLALAFVLPRGLPGEALQLRDEEGRVVPVQVTTDRHAAFVLAKLEANERRRFTIEPALDLRRFPSVEALRHRDRVEIAVGGRPLLVYRAEKTTLPTPDIEQALQRGGYIHPVITPRGRMVTDDYSPTRPHHHLT